MGVTREHRAAMLANMAASLIEHGRIQTTLAKAKVLRPFIEKVITKAKQAAAKTEKKDAITKLFNETYKEFANRNGGYTRIYKLGAQRQSDAAELALIEFVKAEDIGYKKSKGRKSGKAKKAKAPVVAAETAPAVETPKAADEVQS